MNSFEHLHSELTRLCPDMEVLEQEPMSRYTSFRIGGPARLMAFPGTLEEVRTAVCAARDAGIVPFFLGNGTNLLVSDDGYEGFVIHPGGIFCSASSEEGGLIRAGAAMTLSALSRTALDLGLTGLEFASGIPGTVGGAVTMNAGAYGGETVQVLRSVTAMDLNGTLSEIPAQDCGLGYRKSIFTDGSRLILSALFALQPGDREQIRARMEDLARRRKEKQPLEYPSAGSTFKRPPGYYAAALIDQCGCRGLTSGGAQVSEKHAGFVINRGGATCADVLDLVRQVRERVRSRTGVELELEVRLLP